MFRKISCNFATEAVNTVITHDYNNVTDVSVLERLKFYLLSIFWSFLLLLKLCTLWLWNSKKYFALKRRDKPPRCLVDSALGQHSYLKLKGAKLHYVESGCNDHPPLILLHGFLDCWIGWRHQIPALAPHFRVIAVDLRGYGDSEKPLWRRKYRIQELIQELADFISIIGGGEKCIVIGHDLGALLGWFLLYTHPDLVSSFVSIACPHPNVFWDETQKLTTFNNRFVQECLFPWVAEVQMMREDLAILDQYLHHLPAQSSAKGVVSRETYKYIFSRNVDWTGALNYYRSLWCTRVIEDADQVNIPLLLIVGDNDKSCSLEAAVRSTEKEEKLTVRVVSDTGHFPHQQSPASVNKLLLNFLSVPDGRIGCVSSSPQVPNPGLMNRMFGALSTTVQYGNHVLGTVTKRPLNDITHSRNPTLDGALAS